MSKKNTQYTNVSDVLGGRELTYSPFTESSKVDRLRIMELAYAKNLSEWSTTRFKWEGMPDTIDERFVEMELFYRGFILFYYDNRFDRYLVSRATHVGPLNVYSNPTRFRTVDMPNYRGIYLSPKQCVPIWSSYSRMTERDIVLQYSARLAEMDTSIQTVAKAMRINTIIGASRGQQLTYKNVMKQLHEGVDVIYADENFNLDSIQALNLGVNPSILPALRDEKNQLWNEAMTMLGIDNANQDKKERLVVDEVQANDGQIMVARAAAMKARKEAADQINRMFDLDVRVVWNADIPDVPQQPLMLEGDDNGNVHDGIKEAG